MDARKREVMEEFIRVYGSEPCIWNAKCSEYTQRHRKEAAYAKLVNVLKDIEPKANRESVLKKINTLRSNFRKELKKVKADSTYKSSLWYYDLISFLADECKTRPSASAVNNDDDDTNEEETENEEQVVVLCDSISFTGPRTQQDPLTPPLHEEKPFQRTPALKRPSSSNDDDLVERILQSEHFKLPKREEDVFDVFGKYVAMKMRDLPRHQRVMAEKLINDALSEAEMDNLDPTYRIISSCAFSPGSPSLTNDRDSSIKSLVEAIKKQRYT